MSRQRRSFNPADYLRGPLCGRGHRRRATARSRRLPKSTWVDRSLSKTGQAQPALPGQLRSQLQPSRMATPSPKYIQGVLRFPFMAKAPYDPAVDFTYIIGISGLTLRAGRQKRRPGRHLTNFSQTQRRTRARSIMALRQARPRRTSRCSRLRGGAASSGPMCHSKLCRVEQRSRRSHPCRLGCRRLGAARQLRRAPVVGDLWVEPHPQLADDTNPA